MLEILYVLDNNFLGTDTDMITGGKAYLRSGRMAHPCPINVGPGVVSHCLVKEIGHTATGAEGILVYSIHNNSMVTTHKLLVTQLRKILIFQLTCLNL